MLVRGLAGAGFAVPGPPIFGVIFEWTTLQRGLSQATIAVVKVTTPSAVRMAVRARMREHFRQAEILELTYAMGTFIGYGNRS